MSTCEDLLLFGEQPWSRLGLRCWQTLKNAYAALIDLSGEDNGYGREATSSMLDGLVLTSSLHCPSQETQILVGGRDWRGRLITDE